MNKSERINIISRILDEQYKETPVPLDHRDPFTLLIAVLLSAQCTDERVNKVTPLLFEKASDPEEMRKLSEKKIYGIIRPCGLGPQKSKAIKNLSNILVRDYEGRVPSDLIELEKLPGVVIKPLQLLLVWHLISPHFR